MKKLALLIAFVICIASTTLGQTFSPSPTFLGSFETDPIVCSPLVPTWYWNKVDKKFKYCDTVNHWDYIGTSVETLINNANKLDTAISTANGNPSTVYHGVITTSITVSTAKTIPANLILTFRNGGKLVKSGSGTVAFAGVGLNEPDSTTAIFSGFAAGNITFTGATADLRPAIVSTELWDTGNSSLSDRLDRADKSVASGTQLNIAAYPRTITSTTTLRQKRDVLFHDGDYLKTNAGSAFVVDSYTRLHGSHLARLHEGGDVGIGGGQMVRPVDLYATLYDIFVEDLWFEGNPYAISTNASSTVILGNAQNSAIRRNVFNKVHEYAAILGGYGDTGNYAFNSGIYDNQFISCGLQVVALINGKNITIARNQFYQPNSTMSPTYTVIDVEPNNADDKIDGLTIEDNYIDSRDFTPPAVNFAPTDIDITADTITIPNHGLPSGRIGQFTSTGTLPSGILPSTNYFIIPVDDNTLQFRDGSNNIVNFTSQGTGTLTFTTATRYQYGILVQARMTNGSAKNVVVRNNTVIGSDMLPSAGGTLLSGIGVNGMNAQVYGNTITSGIQGALNIGLSRYAQIFNNTIIESSDQGGQYNQININAVGDSDIYGNVIRTSFNGGHAGARENEVFWEASSSGSTISAVYNTAFIYDYFNGMQFVFNGTTYTAASIPSVTSITTTVPVGTVTAQSFAPAAVNTATDQITITGHSFVTGARVYFKNSGGALPAHTVPTIDYEFGAQPLYYVINIDANHIQLASSYENAKNSVAIDFTDAGTGTHTIQPILETHFSNNKWSDNYTPDGIKLMPYGNSQIISTKSDGDITNVSDVDYTLTSANGTLIYTSLTTGRVVNLPDALMCKGKIFTIKDGTGSAATYNITLDGSGTQTIDGVATKAITSNSGSITIKSNGANWVSIGSTSSPLTVGDPVVGGGANRLLFEDDTGKLTTSSKFYTDDTTGTIAVNYGSGSSTGFFIMPSGSTKANITTGPWLGGLIYGGAGGPGTGLFGKSGEPFFYIHDDDTFSLGSTLGYASTRLRMAGLGNTAATFGLIVENVTSGTPPSGSGNYVLAVRDDQRIGINQISPTAALHVEGTNSALPVLVVKQPAAQSANSFEVNSSGGSGGDIFSIDSTGNVTLPDLKAILSGGKNLLMYNSAGTTIALNSSAVSDLTLGFGSNVRFGNPIIPTWYAHLNTTRFALPSTSQFNFGSTSDPTSTVDTGLGRNAAGVIKGTNGSTGIVGFMGGGSSVASAAALPVPTGRVFHVTGTTTITSITSTNLQAGVCITMIFDGALTVTDNNGTLNLAGDFVTTANDTLSLCYDGTNWFETSRSIN